MIAMMDAAWLPMSVVPLDRRVDLRAERWVAGHDLLRVEIFPRCKWNPGGTVRHPTPYWRALPTGWRPTHWREVTAENQTTRSQESANV